MDSFGKSNDAENVKHERVDCGDKNKFKCACGKVYDFHRSLTSHIEHNTISYTCPHCSKLFATPVGFKKHLNNRICTRGISDDDDDDDDDSFENEHSSKSSLHGSSRKSSRTPPASSNARG